MAPYEAVPAVLRNPDPALLRRALGVLSQYAPEAIALGQRFADAGHELALVGGPVRDAFLGKAGVDLDFATSARPEETERILAAWGQATWDMGREFGTIGARKGDVVGEGATYRSGTYDPTSRKPGAGDGDRHDRDLQ